MQYISSPQFLIFMLQLISKFLKIYFESPSWFLDFSLHLNQQISDPYPYPLVSYFDSLVSDPQISDPESSDLKILGLKFDLIFLGWSIRTNFVASWTHSLTNPGEN